MSIRDAIATDLVISPFGADVPAMVDVARCAEDAGFDGAWTLDHFSGAMLGRPWSHDPFTVLGAIAEATDKRVQQLEAGDATAQVDFTWGN